mgnify:CR=1 FL=1
MKGLLSRRAKAQAPNISNENASKSNGAKLQGKLETDSHSDQLSEIHKTLKAIKRGDFTARVSLDGAGVINEIAELINDIVELNQDTTNEITRPEINRMFEMD